jgi:predicted ATPase
MVTRLQLGNFKSFRELVLPLTVRNVLIGPNMAGKTNLIAAFRFLRLLVQGSPGGRGLTAAFNALAPGGVEELLWRGSELRLISIVAAGDFREFPDHSESDTWDYKLDVIAPLHASPRIEGESLEVSTSRGRAALIERDKRTGDRILRNVDHTEISRLSDAERSALEFEIPQWEANSLTNLFRSFQFFKLVPDAMKRVNAASAVTSLAEDGSNLSAWLMFLQTRFRPSFDLIEQAPLCQ